MNLKKIIIANIMIILSSIIPVNAEEINENPYDSYKEGITYYKDGDFDNAAHKMEQALEGYKKIYFEVNDEKIKESLEGIYTDLGIVYLAQEDFDSSIKSLNEAIKLNNNSERAFKTLGNVYYKLSENGQTVEKNKNLILAISQYKEVLKINPQNALVFNMIGASYFILENIDESINALKNAIKLMPDLQPSHFFLAINYYKKGEVKEALNHAIIANKINPADRSELLETLIHYLNGLENYNQKRYYEAIIEFKEAIKNRQTTEEISKYISPLGSIHYNLANSYFNLGKINDARTNYNFAIFLNKDDLNSHLKLASILIKLNWLDLAIDEYKEITRLSPNSTTAIKTLGELYSKRGSEYVKDKNMENAIISFKNGCELNNSGSCDLLNKYRYSK
jgi:tetratricopeptide (TPR) repeat protein